MGSFKDRTGKSRLRTLIDKALAKDSKIPGFVLDLAEIAFPRIEQVREAIENLQKDNEMDGYLKGEIIDVLNDYLAEMQQVGERHKTDTYSDSWLSKNVRPITLLFLLVFCSAVSILNSLFSYVNYDELKAGKRVIFNMDQEVQLYWLSIFSVAVGFYFGGRELGKAVSSITTSIRNRKA